MYKNQINSLNVTRKRNLNSKRTALLGVGTYELSSGIKKHMSKSRETSPLHIFLLAGQVANPGSAALLPTYTI
jgi:hypothetical protein